MNLNIKVLNITDLTEDESDLLMRTERIKPTCPSMNLFGLECASANRLYALFRKVGYSVNMKSNSDGYNMEVRFN